MSKGQVIPYNRQQRRALEKQKRHQQAKEAAAAAQKRQGGDITDPAEAQALLEGLTVPALVAGINNTLEVLEKRGIVPKDYDHKERGLFRLKVIKGSVYYLVDDPEEEGGETEQ